jgi:hypothetical protein
MKGKIFNAQEVQSILNGSKTMFREVIKPRIKVENYKLDDGSGIGMEILLEECPYQVGQKIFVKESFDGYADSKLLNKYNILYRADGKLSKGSSWKPAQQMKQEHSRITLEITDIKVERLQDISKEDAIKEGATSRPNCHGYANRYEGWCMNWNKVGETSKWASNRKTLSESDICMGSAQYAFINSWIATHKKPEEKFEANPFVWVVDFKINK